MLYSGCMNSDSDNITEMVAAIENEMAVPHRMPTLRKLRRKFSKLLQNQYASVVVRIAQTLIRNRSPGGRFMAYELIQHHPTAPELVGSLQLFRLGLGIDSQEAIDMFATYLVGPAWREGRVNDSFVEYWAKSSNRLWRRGAMVATVSLNAKAQGGTGDAPRTLAVCRLLVDERDEMVIKAMITALHELCKRDAMAVAKFIEEYRRKLSPRVIREVESKIPKAKKSPKALK